MILLLRIKLKVKNKTYNNKLQFSGLIVEYCLIGGGFDTQLLHYYITFVLNNRLRLLDMLLIEHELGLLSKIVFYISLSLCIFKIGQAKSG